MVRFLFLAALIFLTPHAVLAAGACSVLKPRATAININLEIPEPAYNLSRSRWALDSSQKQMKQRWLEQNKLEPLWGRMEVTGYADGGTATAFDFKIQSYPYDSYGINSCVFFDEININIIYRTIIFIPAEFKSNACAFAVVNTHELKHHKMNETVIRSYVQRLREDIGFMVDEMEGAYIASRNFEHHVEKMKEAITDAVTIYLSDYLLQSMEANNAQIDSPQEYALTSLMLDRCKVAPLKVPDQQGGGK